MRAKQNNGRQSNGRGHRIKPTSVASERPTADAQNAAASLKQLEQAQAYVASARSDLGTYVAQLERDLAQERAAHARTAEDANATIDVLERTHAEQFEKLDRDWSEKHATLLGQHSVLKNQHEAQTARLRRAHAEAAEGLSVAKAG